MMQRITAPHFTSPLLLDKETQTTTFGECRPGFSELGSIASEVIISVFIAPAMRLSEGSGVRK
jgi:hypothetical protein